MPSRPFHVAIVGAGPAGSAAAIGLAAADLQVTLLERAATPRDKVCGDGCTPATMRWLAALGVTDLPATEARSIRRMHLVSPSGHRFLSRLADTDDDERAAVVPRAVLDALLVRRAVEAGGRLLDGTRVETVRPGRHDVTLTCRGGRELRADVVLGCDGARSVVRRAVGLPVDVRHEAVGVRTYYEGLDLSDAEAISVYWSRELIPAYGWIFPLPGGRANVGIGVMPGGTRRGRPSAGELFRTFCRLPAVAAELAGGRQVGPLHGHPLPMGGLTAPVVHGLVMLLGDAAGFVHPLTGEGLEYALASGVLASRTILESFGPSGFSAERLVRYDERCRAQFGATFRSARLLRRVFRAPRLLDRLVHRAARCPSVGDELLALLLGRSGRPSLRLLAAATLGV